MYETKAILSLLAHDIAKADSAEEAYLAVVAAANVEGVQLPAYEEARKSFEKIKNEKK